MDVEIRSAEPEDYDAVASFTRETWPERGDDYIPHIYHDWIADDGDRKRTLVADAGDGEIAGIAQCALLSPFEAWCQGMRVDPDFKGRGVGRRITEALFDWARERGATVARNMVFSWNAAGLGQSRAVGFAPETEFRWAHPEPDEGVEPGHPVTNDPDAAWSYWTRCRARSHLAGLALDLDESWALSELTRGDLHRVAEDDGVFAVGGEDGIRGMALRVREYERPSEEDPETVAEYGVGAWEDLDAARSLFAAIGADAGRLDVDTTRVLIPETVRIVSDAAAARVKFADEPDFVLAADLTARNRDRA